MHRLILLGILTLTLVGCGSNVGSELPGVLDVETVSPVPTIFSLTSTPTLEAVAATVTPTLAATDTPIPPDATLAPQPPANATQLRLEIGAQYPQSYWLQVYSFPEQFIGQKVVMQGWVIEVIDANDFRIRLPNNRPAFIVSAMPLSGIEYGDELWVYATVDGLLCAYNGGMDDFCQLLLINAIVGR